MKIVVLAGGISSERAVSIVSGTFVCEALRSRGHRAILVDVFCGIEQTEQGDAFPARYDVEAAASYIHSFDERLTGMQGERTEFFGPNVIELCREAEVVFLALHGENGENGKLQAAFDLLGITYTGPGHLGSAMAMDKGITKKIFEGAKIPTPKGVILERGQSTLLSDYGMRLPVVVKPCCGGSSVGIDIAWDLQTYEQAVQTAFSYEDEIVIEEYIKGREFSIGVLGTQALPIIEIRPVEGFYSYENKYREGATIETCPADLTPAQTDKMQQIALDAFEALKLEAYSRLDFMMNEEGEMYCLEANTLPGMTPTSLLPQEAAVCGMDFPALCEELVRLSLQKYEDTP